MKSRQFVLALLAFVLLASACGLVPEQTPTLTGIPVDSGTGGTSTEPAKSASSVTPETQMPAKTRTPVPTDTPGSDETLMVNRQGDLAPNLVDKRGRSLYVSVNDVPHSGLSACLDDCAVEWPPLTVSGPPLAGEEVDPALIGTISRPDGSTQATYNGWPLYYYNSDTIPGSTFGQNYNGKWFLLSPMGEPIRK